MSQVRIALGLVRSRHAEYRWRLIAAPVGALAAILVVCVGLALASLNARQAERQSERTFSLSTTPRSTDVNMVQDFSIWRGHRIVVNWIEPAGKGAPALPPGMSHFPEPGQAVVSPALDILARETSSLAAAFERRSVLKDEGVRSGGELLAYVRPALGRRIGGESDAIRVDGGNVTGDGPVARISSFGGPGIAVVPADEVPRAQLAAALVGATLVPALILLIISLQVASRSRDRRMALLRVVGAPRSYLAGLGAIEALLLTGPSYAFGAGTWRLIAPRLTEFPFTDYRVVRGDLGVSGETLLVLVLAFAVLSIGVGASETLRRSRPRRTADAGSRPPLLSRLGVTPLAVAAALLLAGPLLGPKLGANVILAGIIAAVVAAPACLSLLMHGVGRVLGRSTRLEVMLTGRTLEQQPARAARPYVGLAALAVLGLSVVGVYGVANVADDALATERISAVAVEWSDVRPSDRSNLDRELPGAVVAPLVLQPLNHPAEAASHGPEQSGPENHESHETDASADEEIAHDHNSPVDVALSVPCEDLQTLLGRDACAPGRLSAQGESQLRSALASAVHQPVRAVTLTDDQVTTNRLLVLSDRSLSWTDSAVRMAAMRHLPAAHVDSGIFRITPPPQVVDQWIVAGAALSLITLAFASVLSMIDRALQQREQHRILLNFGASPRFLFRFGAVNFAVPFVASASVGTVIGVGTCGRLLDSGASLPWHVVATGLIVIAGFGLLGAGAMGVFGSKMAAAAPE